MYLRPSVFVTSSYILGILLSRFFILPLPYCVVLASIVSTSVFVPNLYSRLFSSEETVKKEYFNRICFYIGVFLAGYFMYRIIGCRPEGTFENNIFSEGIGSVKSFLSNILYFNFPAAEARNFFAGLFLGERYRMSPALLDAFRKTNTMHVLAISGFHVGLAGLLLMAVLRLLFVPRKTASFIAIVTIFFYVTIVGWNPPAFRTAVMLCILLSGNILDRPVDISNSLSLAALVILLFSPEALFDAGFLLSFIIVFSLIIFAPIIERQKSFIMKAIVSSVVAWLASLPLIAHYFGIISPISILTNIFIVPAVEIVLMLGAYSIFLGLIYIPIAGIFNGVNYCLITFILWFVEKAASIPGAYFLINKFPISAILIYYSVFFSCFLLLQKKRFMIK